MTVQLLSLLLFIEGIAPTHSEFECGQIPLAVSLKQRSPSKHHAPSTKHLH
jgi:hypothetical protein